MRKYKISTDTKISKSLKKKKEVEKIGLGPFKVLPLRAYSYLLMITLGSFTNLNNIDILRTLGITKIVWLSSITHL